MNLNLWGRLLFIISAKYWKSPIKITDSCETNFTVLPGDLDLNIHMNNARYFAWMDLGRLDLMQRSGLLKKLRKRKWFPVVADEMISFGKSLDLFQKVTLTTKIHGWDDKYFYLEQKFRINHKTYAGALVKSRILSKDKALFTKEIFEAMELNLESPSMEEWLKLWKQARIDLLDRRT